MPVPAGIIAMWPGTNASIPAGWTRVTSLDGRFVKGAAAGQNPDVTGGAATHSHVASAHSHTGLTHTHAGATSNSASSMAGQGGVSSEPSSHTHSVGTSGAASTSTSSSDVATWQTASNEPAYYAVIFIQSDGSPAGFPTGACLFWNSTGGATANLEPNSGFESDTTGWIALGDGAIARVTTEQKIGVASCQVTCAVTNDGIQRSQTLTGIAASTPHTFAVWVKAAAGETVTVQWNEYDAGGSYLGIAHSTNLVGDGSWQRVVVTATTSASCAQVSEFAYSASGAQVFYIDEVVFCVGAATPTWVQHAASKGKHLKGATAAGDAGATGGSNTHAHVANGHSHSLTHSHSAITSGAASFGGSAPSITGGGPSVSGVADAHTHSVSFSSTTMTTTSATSANSGSGNAEPAYYTLPVTANTSDAEQYGESGRYIALWLGLLSAIPAGWRLCDGTSGAPDLRNRFPKAANVLSELGTTGGSVGHAHTSPTGHTHGTASHQHSATLASGNAGSATAGSGTQYNVTPPGAHTHGSGPNTANDGSGTTSGSTAQDAPTTSDTQPPFRSVAFLVLDRVLEAAIETPDQDTVLPVPSFEVTWSIAYNPAPNIVTDPLVGAAGAGSDYIATGSGTVTVTRDAAPPVLPPAGAAIKVVADGTASLQGWRNPGDSTPALYPVQAGADYVIRMRVLVAAGQESQVLRGSALFYQADGTFISQLDGSPDFSGLSSSEWMRTEQIVTAPALAAWMKLRMRRAGTAGGTRTFWTADLYAGEHAVPVQSAYRLFIYADDQSTVVYDSGLLAGATQAHTVPSGYLSNNRTYYLQVEVTDDAQLFAISPLRRVTTSWTPPNAIAGLSVTPVSSLPGLLVAWDAIEPVEDETFLQYNVKRRRAAYTDAFGRAIAAGPYVRITVLIGISAPAYTDHHTGAGVAHEYAVTWTANVSGDVLESDEQEPPVAGTVRWSGGYLHDPADPTVYTAVLVREASVEQQQQQATLRARGRREDTVFVGEGFQRAYEVTPATDAIRDRGAWERLRSMLDRQFSGASYCLRIGYSGEVVFGRLESLRLQDRTALTQPVFKFSETHYEEAI